MLKTLLSSLQTRLEPAAAKTAARRRGDASEQAAVVFLASKGLSLVQRNYQCRFGEIDLIMREAETLVFIEVRYRKNTQFGGALASVHPHKQQRIIAAANLYLASLSTVPPCRFDVVTHHANEQVEWLRDAFQTT